MPGVRQDEAERRVLSELQRHLLTNETYATFRSRVEVEVAALSERVNADIRRVNTQVAEAHEAVGNLVAAIAKGRHGMALLSALKEAEARLAAGEATRAGMAPVGIELPEDLPRVYRAQVTHLRLRSRTRWRQDGRVSRCAGSSRRSW